MNFRGFAKIPKVPYRGIPYACIVQIPPKSNFRMLIYVPIRGYLYYLTISPYHGKFPYTGKSL